MNSLKKKRRVQFLVIFTAALALTSVLIGYGLKEGISYFRSPSELVKAPPSVNETFRLGGLVEVGSVRVNSMGTLVFTITDTQASVVVYYNKKNWPDLFAEGQGVIAKGKFDNDIFYASEILAKHDESYMPKEVIDTLKEQGVYQKPKKN
ncbi:MAG: cytochrome c maturation protein CcmE [Proteobacteria bacterium]|nr:cytochrome c maturation protein CcmE [Pseudomonadota bacterium]MDA1239138.1 cytochrome c maturation protein CcmE [Pseudomonadota bacterium]